jgi:hypothetical protein
MEQHRNEFHLHTVGHAQITNNGPASNERGTLIIGDISDSHVSAAEKRVTAEGVPRL